MPPPPPPRLGVPEDLSFSRSTTPGYPQPPEASLGPKSSLGLQDATTQRPQLSSRRSRCSAAVSYPSTRTQPDLTTCLSPSDRAADTQNPSASSDLHSSRFASINPIMAKEAPPPSEPSSPTSSEDGGDSQSRSTTRKGQTKASKPRLTAHQKNTNHKDAENKRRNAIREQFTRLAELVPGAEGQERSEQVMLLKTVEHLREVLEERRRLTAEIEAKGGVVPDDMKLADDEWGGPDWTPKNLNDFETKKAQRKGSGQAEGTQNGDAEGEDD